MEFNTPNNWDPLQRYTRNDVVLYDNHVYYAIKANQGVIPPSSTEFWSNGSSFIWKPTYSSNIDENPNINEVKYGDGYSQRSPAGINNTFFTNINLKFNEVSDKEAYAISYFLNSKIGQSFTFTIPDPYNKTIKVICREWNNQPNYLDNNNLSAKFEEYYEINLQPDSLSTLAIAQDTLYRFYAQNYDTGNIESFSLPVEETVSIYSEDAASVIVASSNFYFKPMNNFGRMDGTFIKIYIHPLNPPTSDSEWRNYWLDGEKHSFWIKKGSAIVEDPTQEIPTDFTHAYSPQYFPWKHEYLSEEIDYIDGSPANGLNQTLEDGKTCKSTLENALYYWWRGSSFTFQNYQNMDDGDKEAVFYPASASVSFPAQSRILPLRCDYIFTGNVGYSGTIWGDLTFAGTGYVGFFAPEFTNYTSLDKVFDFIDVRGVRTSVVTGANTAYQGYTYVVGSTRFRLLAPSATAYPHIEYWGPRTELNYFGIGGTGLAYSMLFDPDGYTIFNTMGTNVYSSFAYPGFSEGGFMSQGNLYLCTQCWEYLNVVTTLPDITVVTPKVKKIGSCFCK